MEHNSHVQERVYVVGVLVAHEQVRQPNSMHTRCSLVQQILAMYYTTPYSSAPVLPFHRLCMPHVVLYPHALSCQQAWWPAMSICPRACTFHGPHSDRGYLSSCMGTCKLGQPGHLRRLSTGEGHSQLVDCTEAPAICSGTIPVCLYKNIDIPETYCHSDAAALSIA
jgi:hypothetical protein